MPKVVAFAKRACRSMASNRLQTPWRLHKNDLVSAGNTGLTAPTYRTGRNGASNYIQATENGSEPIPSNVDLPEKAEKKSTLKSSKFPMEK